MQPKFKESDFSYRYPDMKRLPDGYRCQVRFSRPPVSPPHPQAWVRSLSAIIASPGYIPLLAAGRVQTAQQP